MSLTLSPGDLYTFIDDSDDILTAVKRAPIVGDKFPKQFAANEPLRIFEIKAIRQVAPFKIAYETVFLDFEQPIGTADFCPVPTRDPDAPIGTTTDLVP